ncbi:ion channel [Neptunicella marina]|uniref:Ion transporter n=1 Tax=Neptunicella marina TaxID=2125989 RepID=A0A8J6M2M0_9ALTE|nr:ion channel [Neptunicella marina]MBC3764541.1 ion transporter [Neptunicella marina]
MANSKQQNGSGLAGFKQQLKRLYFGSDNVAKSFRWSLLGFDAITIIYFIAASFLHHVDDWRWVEIIIGAVYLLEWLARMWLSSHKIKELFHPVGLADLIVIFSLLAPSLAENFSFLRIARSLRLLRSYHMLKAFREQSRFVRQNEDILFSVVNLAVFIFVITAVVFVSQKSSNPAINDYVDALYFTIATLTTTGFGDITLVGTSGHILAVLIMIFGISLFLRLIQTIFRPNKVKYECPACGLNRHDADAIHCKHCGKLIHIDTEGAD